MNAQFEHSKRLIELLPKIAAEGMQSFDRLCLLAMEAFRANVIGGDIVEMGCHKGNTARWLRELCPNKRMWLYDTFTGQPEDGEGFKQGSMMASKLEWLEDDPHVVVIPNDIRYFTDPDTTSLPKQIALAHLDMDGYSSTLHGLWLVFPRMRDGGTIIVDDYHDPNYPGVQRAVMDFLVKLDIPITSEFTFYGCAGQHMASVRIRL